MNSPNEDNIDVIKQLKYLWNSKKLIIFFCFLTSVFSLGISYLIEDKYMSHSIQELVSDEQISMPSIELPSFGGLAESAGIDLNKKSQLDSVVIETVKSRTFLKHLLSIESLKDKLIYDRKLESESYIEIHKKIYSEDLNVYKNKDTGLIHFSFKHSSPEFSQYFLEVVIDEINSVFKESKIKELDLAREYFENEFTSATERSLRDSISFLIEKNINSSMLANVRSEYVLKTVEEPYIPEEKHSPIRILFIILGGAFGFLIISLFILIRSNLHDNFS
tara:strand:+ start:58 stop:888 length:831 start_codon:yes stop_codon:yes gene_type:complete